MSARRRKRLIADMARRCVSALERAATYAKLGCPDLERGARGDAEVWSGAAFAVVRGVAG